MAEDFIEEIYKPSKAVCMLKQCGEYVRVRNYTEFTKLWKKTADILSEILNEYVQLDETKAKQLHDEIQRFINKTDDVYMAGDILEHDVIPSLYEYIKGMGQIDVTEGNWKFVSSRSGFLTILDSTYNTYLHSIDNPLWDEVVRARYFYNGEYDKAYILGLGLGYFPYALWQESKGSTEIYVYENSSELVDYARRYGVLDWIPEENLHVIVNENIDELVLGFLEDRKNDDKEELVYVNDWFAKRLSGVSLEIIANMKSEAETQQHFKRLYDINFSRNKNRFKGNFSDIIPKESKEYIVVAAGPSLDDNIDYLRECVSKKVIVAVNTVLRRLLNEGIKPDYVCVLDPTDGIYAHIKGIESRTQEVPLIAESVAYWKYIKEYKGDIYRVLGAGYGPVRDEAVLNPKDTFYIGGTVASLALEIAIKMGAKQVELIGVDLGTPGNKYYAGDKTNVNNNDYNRHVKVPATDGGMVDSADTFIIFKEYLEGQIKKHPEILFINRSEHGCHIVGTICGPWVNCINLSEIEKVFENSLSAIKGMLSVATALSDIYVGVDLKNIRDYSLDTDVKIDDNEIELIRKWRIFAKKVKCDKGVIFLDSLLAEMTHLPEDTIALLNSALESSLNKEQLFYVYTQVKEKLNAKKYATGEAVIDALRAIKARITDLYCKEISIESGQSESLNNSFTYYFVSEIKRESTELNHIKEDCLKQINKGRKTLIINASDKLPSKGRIRFFNSVMADDEDEFFSLNTINYKGIEIPYFQCEPIMPDVGNIRIVLDSVFEAKPARLVSTEDGPLTWLLSKCRNVETI